MFLSFWSKISSPFSFSNNFKITLAKRKWEVLCTHTVTLVFIIQYFMYFSIIFSFKWVFSKLHKNRENLVFIISYIFTELGVNCQRFACKKTKDFHSILLCIVLYSFQCLFFFLITLLFTFSSICQSLKFFSVSFSFYSNLLILSNMFIFSLIFSCVQ